MVQRVVSTAEVAKDFCDLEKNRDNDGTNRAN